jgi:ubiquinone/menaquinone biosynthesis C-methylase UbiE
VDKLDLPGVDVVHDLEVFPYPFEENQFSEVLCHHVLEHLEDQVGVMEELYRITAPDGWIRIEVPYFTSVRSYRDPTHVVHHTYYSFHYFVEGHKMTNFSYSEARFRVGNHRLIFSRDWGLGSILSKLSMRRYEKYYAYRYPAKGLFIELQPIK